MTYTIQHANNLNPILVSDNTIDNSTSVFLVGKNVPDYGSLLDQNFLQLMENFANNVAPINPIPGQLWYDTGGNGAPPLLKVFNGVRFKSVVTVISAISSPIGPGIGDLWLDTSDNAHPGLMMYTASGWVLVGPPRGSGQVISEQIQDTSGVFHDVISMQINSVRYAIMVKDQQFTPYPVGSIPGFAKLYPGMNLANTSFIQNNRFVGRSTDSDMLEGLHARQFMRSDVNTGTTGTLSVYNDNGILLGNSHYTMSIRNADTLLTSQYVNGAIRNLVKRPSTFGDVGAYDALDIWGNGDVSINSSLTVNNMGNFIGGLQAGGGSPDHLTQWATDGSTITYTPNIVNNNGYLQVDQQLLVTTGTGTAGPYTPAGQLHILTNEPASLVIQNTNKGPDQFAQLVLGGAGAAADAFTTQYHTYTDTNTNQAMFGWSSSTANGTLRTPLAHYQYISNVWSFFGGGALRAQIDTALRTVVGTDIRSGANISAAGYINSTVNNLKITGGTVNQHLVTTGGGNLQWVDQIAYTNVETAERLLHPRDIRLAGDATGNLGTNLFDGSANVTITASVNRLHVPRKIEATGDATWYVNFDGSQNVSSALTLADLGAAGTYYTVNVNNKGLVTGGSTVNPLSGTQNAVAFFDTTQSIGSSGMLWDSTNTLMTLTGTLNVTQDIVAFSTSDTRLKTNLEQIINPLSRLKQLTGYTFNWNDIAKLHYPSKTDRAEVGLIAQEVADVMPEVVTVRDDGYMAVDYAKIVPLLVEAIKELAAEVETLKGQATF